MRANRVGVIARREYLVRVRSLAFWLATAGLPLLLVAISVLPALLIGRTSIAHRVVVVDETGEVGPLLAERLSSRWNPLAGESRIEVELEPPLPRPESQRAALDRRVLEGGVDAWIWIGRRELARDRVEYHAENVSNLITQQVLERAISGAVREHRLRRAGLDPGAIDDLVRPVELGTVRIGPEGSREQGAAGGIALAYLLFFLLYLVLMIYGQQVLSGVLEEKSSRIVEVVVASTRPFELMLGKLSGICLVALTQLAVWLGTLVLLTLPGVAGAIAWLPEGIDVPSLPPSLLAHFLAHFLLGFFLFSTLYAAIGAAFNHLEEAQQFASLAAVVLLIPALLFLVVINDPDSPTSVAMSLLPPFTPLLMMLRIAIKSPPLWQLATGYLLTTAFALFMVWLSARVYRTGILMYGKKPSLRELWRWIRYA